MFADVDLMKIVAEDKFEYEFIVENYTCWANTCLLGTLNTKISCFTSPQK